MSKQELTREEQIKLLKEKYEDYKALYKECFGDKNQVVFIGYEKGQDWGDFKAGVIGEAELFNLGRALTKWGVSLGGDINELIDAIITQHMVITGEESLRYKNTTKHHRDVLKAINSVKKLTKEYEQ